MSLKRVLRAEAPVLEGHPGDLDRGHGDPGGLARSWRRAFSEEIAGPFRGQALSPWRARAGSRGPGLGRAGREALESRLEGAQTLPLGGRPQIPASLALPPGVKAEQALGDPLGSS